MKLYVKSNEICEEHYQETEKFGEWSSTYSFEIEGVYSAPQESSEEFILDVKKGDTVYALVLTYSTGDSFGSAIGRGELIWLFSEKEYAERVYYEYMNNIEKSSLHLMLEIDGKKFKRTKIGNIVYGWFENLTSLDIEEYTVL